MTEPHASRPVASAESLPAEAAIPFPGREEIAEVIEIVAAEARTYFDGLDRRPVLPKNATEALERFDGSLPTEGIGASAALRQLIDTGFEASAATSGPRCFHFVIGGSTPAATGADWLATMLDQLTYTWVTSPLGVRLELLGLSWLKEMFGLPSSWGAIMTTGATMSNFVGLAAARQWWAERIGVDVSETGLTGLPEVPVFAGDYIHASSVKVLGLLGIGRARVRRCTRDPAGRMDLDLLSRGLDALNGAPAIILATAGEPNAGDFDPIVRVADLAEQYGAWLHVDGAFGLFARLSSRTRHLVEGVERAHSVTVDGHKWLNVPYDCGFAFVRDPGLLVRAFRYTGAYLPPPDDPRPTMGAIGPESSRRARSLAVWATLRAYGREGYRKMVEGHLDLAQRMARQVDDDPVLERLADVPLNIVCFRFNPGGLGEEELNGLNRRLGAAILEDGRFMAGTTTYAGKVALRPAVVNWRTSAEDIDAFVAAVREIGASLAHSE
jgi:glutamate/tyrosine decarboxylase-like PLP-dependent enzyme